MAAPVMPDWTKGTTSRSEGQRHAGDRIRVRRSGAPPSSRGVAPYEYADADRRGTLLWLAGACAALVVVLARRRGLLALAGFAFSLLIIVDFVVPAILAGSPALLVVPRAVHVSASDALTSQDVAEPIVAPLAGVIALLVSVSLTTGLAAARRPHPGRRAP
jgi:uncharacterized membrane protein